MGRFANPDNSAFQVALNSQIYSMQYYYKTVRGFPTGRGFAEIKKIRGTGVRSKGWKSRREYDKRYSWFCI